MAADRTYTHQQKTALFVGAFFDELSRWGVREVVVSPGSRSTALAMCAYEMSRRDPDRMRVYVAVDERGAAFFALGMAKAAGRPVALVCTSGTAVANYLPAMVEADTSRVPILALTGDRPLRLQGLGAPQTCDQVKIFGGYVRAFRQMPEPGVRPCDLSFARQAAREAVVAAMGPGSPVSQADGRSDRRSCGFSEQEGDLFPVASRGCARFAGPVHVNFPFDEPLKPDFEIEGVFEQQMRADLPEVVRMPAVYGALDSETMSSLEAVLRNRRTLILAGEGTCETLAEARAVAAWASSRKFPLLADPLSGLRSLSEDCVIDNYDNILRADDAPLPDAVIRFGRYPVSKVASLRLAKDAQINIVVDVAQTRDFNSLTDMLVACTPLDFVRCDWLGSSDDRQASFMEEWVRRNVGERARIAKARYVSDSNKSRVVDDASGRASARMPHGERELDEGAVVSKMLELIPARSCLFAASSMSVRAVDTFLLKGDKPLAVLCNRGQNGIDGTVSTALGAAQRFAQTTLLIGDFAMLHDLNALALQHELLIHHGADAGDPAGSIVIVLLNNNGGAIFDILPQASNDPYFERLFLAPQDVRFDFAAKAFGVAYAKARTVDEFAQVYEGFLGRPGISIVEVGLPLRGVRERYAPYQER